jgi:hypothetical protein
MGLFDKKEERLTEREWEYRRMIINPYRFKLSELDRISLMAGALSKSSELLIMEQALQNCSIFLADIGVSYNDVLPNVMIKLIGDRIRELK